MTSHDSQLWSYAARELDLGEHRYVQSHLDDCPECVEQLAAVQVAREALELAKTAKPAVEWERLDETVGSIVEKRLKAQARGPALRRFGAVGVVGFAVAVAALLVAFPGLTPLVEPQPPPVPPTELVAPVSSWARVDDARGLTKVNGGPFELKQGTELASGDVLRTTKRGHGFVHLPDRSHLRVGAASQVALTRSEVDDVALTLERGRLAVRASHSPRRGFVVRAQGVAVQVVGTVFSVENDAEVVQVSVSEGKVKVDLPNGEQATVEAGERLRFDTTQSTVKRLELTAAGARELGELVAADEAATAVEGQAVVPAVGGAPSSPPLVLAQGSPRSLPRLSAKEAKSRVVELPQAAVPPAQANQVSELNQVSAPKEVSEPKTEVVIEAPQDVWPTLGGGEIVRGVPERRASVHDFEPAPVSGPDEWALYTPPAVTSSARLREPEVEAAPVAVQSSAKLTEEVEAPKPALASRDLEGIFLSRAEAAATKSGCDKFLLGLEDIALDSQKSARTELARVLRARCFEAQLRPRQATNEYRKYVSDYPAGKYLAEAKRALGE